MQLPQAFDDNNYLYIKCLNVDRETEDIVQYRWIRVKVSKYWENNDSQSLYYEIDEIDNKKKCINNIGDLLPEISFKLIKDTFNINY